jgi:predicted dithiol-disulfide oxidoreductase (DUF899 family)
LYLQRRTNKRTDRCGAFASVIGHEKFDPIRRHGPAQFVIIETADRLEQAMTVHTPPILDRAAWEPAHVAHLAREKEFTRARDAISASRRELPWLEISEPYAFDTNNGPNTLSDLFAGEQQLIIYHFMMGPDWEEGCPSCSFWADGYNGVIEHLAARDTTLMTVSRAPLANINAYKARMGWNSEWASSLGSEFNYDFGVSFREDSSELDYNFGTQSFGGEEAPGLSTLIQQDGTVYLTNQVFSRGLDLFNNAYHMLDATPMGRHEGDLPWPMAWLRRHDSY